MLELRCTLQVTISINPAVVMSVQKKFALGAETLTCARIAPVDGFALIMDNLVELPLLATRMSSSIANRSESTYTMPFTAPRATFDALKARRLLVEAWFTKRTAYDILLYNALALMRYACTPAVLLLSSKPPPMNVSGPDGSTASALTSLVVPIMLPIAGAK